MTPIPVVIHADDFGLSRSFNRGIAQAVSQGLVQSTCLRTNGWAYREAVEEILPQIPDVGMGVHLNIVEGKSGRCITSRSRLCNADGRYRLGFAGLWYGQDDLRLLEEIEIDYIHQIETVLKDGIAIDHLNSHRHSHLLPQLFKIVCRLAHAYKIPFVRLVREPWYRSENRDFFQPWFWANMIKFGVSAMFADRNESMAAASGVKTNTAFVGLLYTGHINTSVIRSGLEAVSGPGPVEVLLHPVVRIAGDQFWEPYVKKYVDASERATELAAVTGSELKDFLRPPRWQLTNFRELNSAGEVMGQS